ncbi:RAM signaling network component [Recurvomyces mirabilis]|uniref:RAM signaling network component n=1 Tax=Recurvomyces mirabilis TaxID=574656 RepID=A0AAE1C069_9PEZI|nr:RAM signaling network component [Recurvomyces mirabilis]KAK5152189.1 RAM signaling network component [Recurvomyces mirabilis]
MATESEQPPMTVAELVAFTQRQLESDAEQQAHIKAAGLVGGHLQSQTGSTLNLSHLEIPALPVEVVALIRDRVERYAKDNGSREVLRMRSLEILDVSKNHITFIPESIKGMTSLKFLAVIKNEITRLPYALGDMPSLTKLKFSENPLEFPPAHVYEEEAMSAESSPKEKERDVCQLVKRYLKAASLRERLRTNSEEDLNESNVETPRPPKRMVTIGRFPVRPSIGGIDDLQTRSPREAPPIPQRSNARDPSSNGLTVKGPGVAPLYTGDNDISRSRSETVSSASSIKSRRQGLVAPKKTNLTHESLAGLGGPESARTSQASTLRASASHSRATSSISTLNGFLTASSGTETSSGAVSPIDGPAGRYGASRRLSSLPESRHSRVQTSDLVRASKRLLFSLFQLQGPVSEVARAVKDGSPKRSVLERHMFSANTRVEELDRLLDKLASGHEEDDRENDLALQNIAKASMGALRVYAMVVKELKQHSHRVVSLTEGLYLRCLMSQIYMTTVEVRNICSSLGFKLKPPGPNKTPRASRAWSSRTVTPTQPKPINSKRARGATILRSMSSNASIRTMAPPVPISSTNTSRSNTMTSTTSSFGGIPTPRSSDLSTLVPSNTSSRTNTLRSEISNISGSTLRMPDYGDDEHFDTIYLQLQRASDLARKSLPHCRTEFASRQSNAETHGGGHTRSAHHWASAVSKCEAVITANNLLHSRLKVVKLKDPGVRNQRDFWQLCDAFVQSWTDLATQIKDLSQQQRLAGSVISGMEDLSSVRGVMRPVQKAVKEVSKVISESPLYQQALRQPFGPMTGGGAGPNGLAPPFPASVNAALAQVVGSQGHLHNVGSYSNGSQGSHSGYVTPVPATPLSAALGPAAQATVASTPTEYFPHGLPTGRSVHESSNGMGRRI